MTTNTLTTDDRRLLSDVFKNHGAVWTYTALAVWYDAVPLEKLYNVKPWTSREFDGFHLLRDLIRDYTFNAIYDTAFAIELPAYMKSVQQRRFIIKKLRSKRAW